MTLADQNLEVIKKECVWKMVAIYTHEEYSDQMYQETHETPPYSGILNPIEDSTLILDPWFTDRAFAEITRQAKNNGKLEDAEDLKTFCRGEALAKVYSESEGERLEIPFEDVSLILIHRGPQ